MTWMIVALVLPVGITGYAYGGYPLILVILARFRGRRDLKNAPVDWPAITIVLPVHNKEAAVAGAWRR